MKVLLNELYKLFIKRKFIIVLAAVFVLEGVSVYSSLAKRIDLDEDSAAVYEEYINKYSGKVTGDKINEIEQLITERSGYETMKENIRREYEVGNISTDDYKTELAELKEKTKGAEGFNKFVSIYYTAADRDLYIADSTQWNVLFGSGGIDFILVAAVVLMVVALIVYDDESGVNKLKFSAKNGKGKLISSQIGIIVFFSAFTAVCVFAGKLLIARVFFDLDGLDNPLYYAEIFNFSNWDLTLIEGYIYLSAIKTAGCVYLGMLSGIIGQICKSSLYTVFISLIAVYIPGYILSSFHGRYMMPLPSSLLAPNGYFSAMEEGGFEPGDGEVEFVMRVFTEKQIIIYFIAVAAVITALIFVNRLLWTKRRKVV